MGEMVKREVVAPKNGQQLTKVSDEFKRAVMPIMAEGFPDLPVGVAKTAIRMMCSDGKTVEEAVRLVELALRDFVPGYGVMYPSVAYLLGKREGDKDVADEQPFDLCGYRVPGPDED